MTVTSVSGGCVCVILRGVGPCCAFTAVATAPAYKASVRLSCGPWDGPEVLRSSLVTPFFFLLCRFTVVNSCSILWEGSFIPVAMAGPLTLLGAIGSEGPAMLGGCQAFGTFLGQAVSPAPPLAVAVSCPPVFSRIWGGGIDACSSASSHVMKGFMAACITAMMVLASSWPSSTVISSMATPSFGGTFFLGHGVGDGSVHEGVIGGADACRPRGVTDRDSCLTARGGFILVTTVAVSDVACGRVVLVVVGVDGPGAGVTSLLRLCTSFL